MENKLVFLEPDKIDAIPFTTSEVIAEFAGINYRAAQKTIETYKSDLENFGKVRLVVTPLINSKTGQSKKIYHLTEEQATLLITFLKNTPTVRAFKIALVHEFYRMKTELLQRQVLRQELKPIRRELTDVIQDDPNHNEWSFKLYTDLAYKAVIGKNAAQIRKERGAKPKAVAVDYMTSAELAQITKKTYQIAALIELGMDYYQIKDVLLKGMLVLPIKKVESVTA
jgi:Uncharacterized phage-encoded protein